MLLQHAGSCRNELLDAALIIVEDGKAFFPLVKIRQPRRKSRFNARRSLHRCREFRGVRGGKRHDRRVAAGELPRNGDGDGGVRVEQIARRGLHGADRLDVSASPVRPAAKSRRIAAMAPAGTVKPPDCLSPLIMVLTASAVAAGGLEQQALEIG